jgi:hypothetical protein
MTPHGFGCSWPMTGLAGCTSTEAGPPVPAPSGTTWAFRNSATRTRSLSRQVLLLVRCAVDVTRLWQRVEQNRFPRLREVSM